MVNALLVVLATKLTVGANLVASTISAPQHYHGRSYHPSFPSSPASHPTSSHPTSTHSCCGPLNHVVTASLPSCTPSPNQKGGRRPKFTATDDLIITREVSAAKAHVAGYGEILKRFADAAERANLNKQLSQKVTAKSIQDRYKKIQDVFNKKDTADRRLSWVGGEIGELDELLGMMQEARNDIEKEKRAVAAAQEAKEARKEQIGRALVARSLARRSSTAGNMGSDDEEDDEGEGGSGSDRGRARKKRRTNSHTPGNALEGELEGFGMALKEADIARVELEKSRLDFERERFEADKEEREKDRALRREEREASNALELEKFKMMMGALMEVKK